MFYSKRCKLLNLQSKQISSFFHCKENLQTIISSSNFGWLLQLIPGLLFIFIQCPSYSLISGYIKLRLWGLNNWRSQFLKNLHGVLVFPKVQKHQFLKKVFLSFCFISQKTHPLCNDIINNNPPTPSPMETVPLFTVWSGAVW